MVPAILLAQTSVLYDDFQGILYNPSPNPTLFNPNYHPGSTETLYTDTTIFPPGTAQSVGANLNFTQPFAQPIVNGTAQVMVASQYAPGASGGTVQPFNAQLSGVNPTAISVQLYATTVTTVYLFLGDDQNTCICGPGNTGGHHETEILTPVTIPANTWTTVVVPLDLAHWDTYLSSIDFTHLTQVFFDTIGPPCAAAIPGGGYSETINYGPISFLSSIAVPTPTPADTPVWSCPTDTFTPTPTNTSTATNTPTFTLTPTITNTPTKTYTLTSTFTPTDTSTPCGYPGNTCTPTPSPVFINIFYVSQNLFNPASGAVSLFVEYNHYPGEYSLRVFNSAGELIKNLDSHYMNGPVDQPYRWDGTNNAGDKCASGVYILYLIEPFDRSLKRILLVR